MTDNIPSIPVRSSWAILCAELGAYWIVSTMTLIEVLYDCDNYSITSLKASKPFRMVTSLAVFVRESLFPCVRTSVKMFCTSSQFQSARLCFSQTFASYSVGFTLNEFGHDTTIVNCRTQSPSWLREVHLGWCWTPTSCNRAHCSRVEQKLSVSVRLQPVKVEFFERLQASSLNQVSSFSFFFTRILGSHSGLVKNRTLLNHKSNWMRDNICSSISTIWPNCPVCAAFTSTP